MKYLLIFCLSLASLFINAQVAEDQSGKFGVKAGWTQSFIGDQHISPLLYQSNSMNLGAIYQRQGAFLLEVSLTVSIGTNQARRLGKRAIVLESTPDIYGDIEYDVIKVNPFLSMAGGDLKVKALWSLNEQHQLGLSFNARHIYTGMGLDDWHYTQVDLSPEYQFSYGFLEGDIQAAFSLPLLAAVVRPNYAYDPSLPNTTSYYRGYLKTGAAITSINDLFNPRFRAGYTWHFRNGKDLGVHYFASWTTYPEPRPVRLFENGLDLIYFF